MNSQPNLRTEVFKGTAYFVPETDKTTMAHRFSTVWHIDLVLNYVKGRSRVIQAGGNLGQWPIHLAGHFKEVHAFEASPLNFQLMCLHTFSKDNIVRYPLALGKGPARVLFKDDPLNCEGSHIGEEGAPVNVVALDSIFDDGEPVDLIALDVEGAEYDALRGAFDILRKKKPTLLIEFREFKRETFDHEDLHRYLLTLGYKHVDNAAKDRIYVCS